MSIRTKSTTKKYLYKKRRFFITHTAYARHSTDHIEAANEMVKKQEWNQNNKQEKKIVNVNKPT